jgi:hypothetical protein
MPGVLATIAASHPKTNEPAAILACLKSLAALVCEQDRMLESRHRLHRNRQRDDRSFAIVLGWDLRAHSAGR